MTEQQQRTERILALMRGEGRGVRPAMARAGLWLLSRLYAFGIGVYLDLYRLRILKRVRLRPFVVSVGNITVGGTGKTTTIQYMARILCSAGLRPAVLSYGYRAADREAVGIVSDGDEVRMTAAEAGDEAVLLARSLPGVPVLIGRRRVISGAVAEERFHPDVLLCDDAFQYWRLERDLDLVLVDAVEPWGHGHVLPRGLLREPRAELRRADGVVVTHADLAEPERLAGLVAELRSLGFGLGSTRRPVFLARHGPVGVSWIDGGEMMETRALSGRKVFAVSSLGDPVSFEATLQRMDAEVTPMRFPDHHRYTEAEVRAAETAARDQRRQLITTAKDAVKIREYAAPGTWLVLEIALELENEPVFRQWVLNTVKTSNKNASNNAPD